MPTAFNSETSLTCEKLRPESFAGPGSQSLGVGCNAVLARLLLFGDNSFLPSSWIAMLVENGDKVNYFTCDTKVYGVRKPPKQGSSHIILDYRKLKWTLDHSLDDSIELVEELAAKPRPLLLVPCSRIAHIEFSLCLDSEASRHRLGLRSRSFARSSSRNSSQDLPARGWAESSWMRSSITCKCQSGTGMASGFAAIRSHSDWT